MLISGCSFTQWPEFPGGPNTCWPRYLSEIRPDLNITNLAEAAAGNQYISDSVIRAVLEKPNYYDHVVVMWSGVTRLDFLTDVLDPNWSALFDSYGFYRRLPEGKLGWIFSGGQLGTWFKNPVAHKMFYEQYKVSSDLSLANINLTEIVKTQNFLENKKIPYHFMSYVNYWNTESQVSPNGDFGVYQYPEIRYLTDSINFDNWLFTTGQDGIYELAKQNNDFTEDGFHPGSATQQSWAKFVSQQFD